MELDAPSARAKLVYVVSIAAVDKYFAFMDSPVEFVGVAVELLFA